MEEIKKVKFICNKCFKSNNIYYSEIVNMLMCSKCGVIGDIVECEPNEDKHKKEERVKEDIINKPNHYHNGGIDPIGLGEKLFTDEEMIGFYKMNILKYRMRAGKKAGNSEEQDVLKAEFYEKKLKEKYNARVYNRGK